MSSKDVVDCDIDLIVEKIRRRADDFKSGLDLIEAVVTEVWEPIKGCEVELFVLVEHDEGVTMANFRHGGFSEDDGSPAIETESIYVPAGGTSMAAIKRSFLRI